MKLAAKTDEMETSETYWELTLSLPEAEQDAAMAELELQGADSFWQEDELLHAYFPPTQELNDSSWRDQFGGAFRGWAPQEQRNWNAEWEASCQSVAVGDFCLIRPEHQPPQGGFRHEVLITPRMAFGTGHHETTQMMVEHLSDLNLAGKTVLDMGCGTGVLGVVALKQGATRVTFVDVDPLATEQTAYNVQINGLPPQDVRTGGAESLFGGSWDVILANINRNVLLADGGAYAAVQPLGGRLVLSGFMDLDESAVIDYFSTIGYQAEATKALGLWRSVVFQRI